MFYATSQNDCANYRDWIFFFLVHVASFNWADLWDVFSPSYIHIYKLVNFPEGPTILENIFGEHETVQKKITSPLKFTFTHLQFSFFWSLQRV